MKKLIFSSLIFTLIIALNFNCDKIEKPYTVTQNTLDTPDFPALTKPIQKYILEDFTGHLCTNCPQAHLIANEIKEIMGDTLILLAIHSGEQAKPSTNPYNADYRTDLGDRITDEFGISSYPKGMISRKIFNKERELNRNSWKANANNIEREEPMLGIQIMCTNKTNNSANIFVKTTFLSNINKDLKLFVLLTESGIVSAQKNSDSKIGPRPDILDYEHNHILRTHISPIEGNIIATSTSPITKDESIIKGYTLDLKATPWNLDKCTIIAFITDNNTKEILQAEEIDF